MYIVVRGYARAYNEIPITQKMQDRRHNSLKRIIVDEDGDGEVSTDEMIGQLQEQSSFKSVADLDKHGESTAVHAMSVVGTSLANCLRRMADARF